MALSNWALWWVSLYFKFLKILTPKEMLTNGWHLFDVILVVLDGFIIALYTVRLVVSDSTMEQFSGFA